MGAKSWMLAYVDGDPKKILKSDPPLDRAAALRLAERLFPKEKLEAIDDVDLTCCNPPDNEVYVGSFPGLTIVAAGEFGVDYPSKLPAEYLTAGNANIVYLHAMHSVVDWFAYAIWVNGELQRSLSLSPDSGILENIGARQSFEEPYWSGKHPLFDEGDEAFEYPFPFHPLDLGEAALLELLGFQLEGIVDSSHVQPELVPLAAFKRSKRRWRLW